ncbi:MAG: MFS transporter [Clostridiales bacterium]|nr:MFS transporter [Clostridiales bacterium]
MSDTNKSKAGYSAVMKQKDFVKMLAANIINRFGDSIDAIAFTWLVYVLTGSAMWSAVIYGVNKIPTIFLQPIAGAHVENRSKKAVMIITDIIRGICVAFIAAAFFLDILKPYMLIITSLIISSAEAFRLPASNAVMVRILEKDTIDFGVSMSASTSNVVELIGAAAGGVIIAMFGITCAIVIDAVTFVVSALIVCSVDTHEQKGEILKGPAQSYRELLKDGCKYIVTEKVVLSFIILAVVANAMFVPLNSLQAPLVAEVLKSSEAMLSVLSVSLSVGMLLSTVVYPYLARRMSGKVKTILFLCGLCFGLYYVSLVAVGKYVNMPQVKYVFVAVGSSVAGFVVSFMSTYITASFLRIVKQEYIARTAAIMNSAGACAIPVVSFLISIASSFVATGVIFIISGVLLTVLIAILAFWLTFEL